MNNTSFPGYHGRILDIDLSKASISEKPLKPGVVDDYLIVKRRRSVNRIRPPRFPLVSWIVPLNYIPGGTSVTPEGIVEYCQYISINR